MKNIIFAGILFLGTALSAYAADTPKLTQEEAIKLATLIDASTLKETSSITPIYRNHDNQHATTLVEVVGVDADGPITYIVVVETGVGQTPIVAGGDAFQDQ